MKINALKTSCMFYFYIDKHILCTNKLGYVVMMVVDSILPHAESGPNDHRKDALPLNSVNIPNHRSK